MKKTLFTLIAISFVSLSYFAQNFEGEITYETTYKTMPEITSTRIVSMSKDDFYKGEQTSINTKMNTSHFSVWIMKNDTVFSYNDFRENICSYFTKVETQKLNTDTIHNNSKLYRLKDTVEILGEKCIKYRKSSTMKTEDGREIKNMELYFVSLFLTSKNVYGIGKMKNHIILKSIRTEEMGENKSRSTETATKIIKKSMPISVFQIPKDRKLVYLDPFSDRPYNPSQENNDRKKKPNKKRKKRNQDTTED